MTASLLMLVSVFCIALIFPMSLLIVVIAYRYWHLVAERHYWTPFPPAMFLVLRMCVVTIGLIGAFLLVLFAPMQFRLLDERPVTIYSNGDQLPQYVMETNPALLEHLQRISTCDDIYSLFLSKSVGGFYMPASRSITLRSVDRVVYWHELSHHIFYWFLTDEERSVYAALHNYDLEHLHLFNTSLPHTFPSIYAHSSVGEDFADTFVVYAAGVDNPFGREIDPRRKEIIDVAIRRITNCTESDPQHCLFSYTQVDIFDFE